MIQKLLVGMEVDIVSRRVKSEDNVTDAVSRGDRSGRNPAFQLPVQIPYDLESRLYQSTD
ncbi:uncharacterized protein PGTG_21703 [Puccinia graminis f. sp. tritici CRL 75-36-700-3]|uniref:Uncharacterized protein n=1 Tax=Puccinia graminis f. sp. tritici (strain CRL 75-36-700-3 / race SCCL) TaxID=418459 RepID=H6QS59_PUCGT|nr:uncharacterized protein PGTG_21703 [Puccinia graminis f. sp. tritici CRL 75-36-700-3]EHS63529.1 hypothetical protein PGTG_21703 [Puccinia graminis f. sp. tritici CRL 75-36-700-3]